MFLKYFLIFILSYQLISFVCWILFESNFSIKYLRRTFLKVDSIVFLKSKFFYLFWFLQVFPLNIIFLKACLERLNKVDDFSFLISDTQVIYQLLFSFWSLKIRVYLTDYNSEIDLWNIFLVNIFLYNYFIKNNKQNAIFLYLKMIKKK